jgi:microcystin-dependent protein
LTGDVSGNVTGDVIGNVTGDLTGDVSGNVTGNVTGDVIGNVIGNLTGDVTGNVTGDLTGDVTGNVSGNTFIFGTAQSTSISTGALVVDGGVGITGDIHTGGNINIKEKNINFLRNDSTIAGYINYQSEGILLGEARGGNHTEITIGASDIVLTTKDENRMTVKEDGNVEITGSLNITGNVTAANSSEFGSPVGSVIMYAGDSAPTGYLLCNGASQSTNTYAALFDVISYTYGGAGASFNLPDLTDRFVRASNGENNNIGTTSDDTTAINGLSVSGTVNKSDFNHEHNITAWASGGGTNNDSVNELSSGQTRSTNAGYNNRYKANEKQFSGTANLDISLSGDLETAPKHIVLGFYIKY